MLSHCVHYEFSTTWCTVLLLLHILSFLSSLYVCSFDAAFSLNLLFWFTCIYIVSMVTLWRTMVLPSISTAPKISQYQMLSLYVHNDFSTICTGVVCGLLSFLQILLFLSSLDVCSSILPFWFTCHIVSMGLLLKKWSYRLSLPCRTEFLSISPAVALCPLWVLNYQYSSFLLQILSCCSSLYVCSFDAPFSSSFPFWFTCNTMCLWVSF